ncbi:hypothetical protein DFH29DRAFT_494629 [Suillus ampliporus]|nr:hypothetical protein DFH29DRAFT_494629 [Suillus ampliporus]
MKLSVFFFVAASACTVLATPLMTEDIAISTLAEARQLSGPDWKRATRGTTTQETAPQNTQPIASEMTQPIATNKKRMAQQTTQHEGPQTTHL